MKALACLLALAVLCGAASGTTVADEQELSRLAHLRDQRVAAGDLQGALQAGRQFLDASTVAFGSEDLRTADGSVRVAMILDMLGKGDDAEAMFRPACDVFVNKSSILDQRPGLCLHALAMLLIKQGRTVEARPISHDAVARLQGTLAPSRLGAATFALAEQLDKNGDKTEANKYFLHSGETLSTLEQSDRSYAVTAFAEAARIAGELGDRLAVRTALERAVTVGEGVGPSENSRVVSLKYQLSDALTSLGDFDRALRLLSEVRSALAVVKREGHAGPESVLPRVAALQLRNGSIDQAIATVEEGLRLSSLRPDPDATKDRIKLALEFVDAAEVIKDYRQSRRLIDTLLIVEDALYAKWQAGRATSKEFSQWFSVISNRISIYQMTRGEFPAARQVLENARARARKVLGEKNELDIAFLSRLGALTLAQQDPASALAYLEEAVQTADSRRAISKEYSLLSELAMAQKLTGQSALAMQTEEKYLAFKERDEGITPSLMADRALLLREKGGADNLKSARILTELAMLADPSSSVIASQLSSIYEEEGDLDKAIDVATKALEIRLQSFGPNHINTAGSYYNLGRLHLKENNKSKARRDFIDAAKIFSARVNDLDEQLSLAELRLTLPSLVDSWRSALIGTGAEEDAAGTFDLVVPWKGRVEEILRRQALWSLAPATPEAKALSGRLEVVRLRMAAWMQQRSDASDSIWQTRLRELIQEKESIERNLNMLSDPAHAIRAPIPSAKRVASMLRAGEVFVDIVRHRTVLPQPPNDGLYSAFIIRHDGAVHQILLGSAMDVDTAITQWRRSIDQSFQARWNFLRTVAWEPILAQLKEADQTVIVSPDDQLALIPWHLFSEKDKKRFVHQVNSSHDIVRPVSSISSSNLKGLPVVLILGALDYGPLATQQNPNGECWQAINGAAQELDDLRKRASASGYRPISLSGQEATKERLQSLLGEAQVVHIATHGYFIPSISENISACSFRSSMEPYSKNAKGVEEDFARRTTLMRSGLVLSDANRTPSKDNSARYFTADDFIGARMNGVHLVVLSACETGLGDNDPGQGVLGLRTAVSVSAGSNLLMSLWKVPDVWTRKLMDEFYSALWTEKLTPMDALLKAQERIRNIPGTNTKDWAGWILVGRP